MKTCSKCDLSKPLTEFNRSSRRGYQSRCRACQKTAYQETRARHKRLMKRANTTRHEADPIARRLSNAATKARQLGCTVESFTSADLLAHWGSRGIDPTRCYYTGEPLGDGWHIDHMTPLSRGGAHAVWNLVPCTASVNISKHDRTADEYLQVAA